jgi:hypothetical protein
MGASEGTFPAPILQKQRRPSALQTTNGLHSCRLLIAEKRGANNQQEQSKA